MTTKYKLTPEHKAQLKPWADKWIANGLSTKPMDDYDRAQMRIAVKGLYESAGLVPPPDNRIVFVESPFVARFAGGFAASIWYNRKNKKIAATRAATDDATRAATAAATAAATDNATYTATRAATAAATDNATYTATDTATAAATDNATRAATDAATYDATRAATRAATAAATDDATNAATYDATRAATDTATAAATRAATAAATYDATRDANKNNYSSVSGYISAGIKLNVGKFGFQCAAESWRMYQGGNFWSGWTAFLSFFKDVVKLPLDYSKYEYWENATIHGSYRIMHPDFCMVSDRPRILKLDDQGRAHCEDGAYMQWSDGMGLFAWHGTNVPEYWIMQKHLLTAKDALTWENVEQRRAACEIVGWHNILKELDAKTIQKDADPQIGELVEVNIPDVGKERFLRVQCGTGREFALPVPPNMQTALQASAWTYGMEHDINNYRIEVRT